MVECPVIEVDSELSGDAAADLLQQLGATLERHPQRVIVDLGRVDRFDSAGMGGVVESIKKAQARGVDLRLRGVSQAMLEFFSLVSVSRLTRSDRADSEGDLDPISRLGALVIPALESLSGIGKTAAAAAHGVFVAPFRGHRLRLDRTVAEVDQCANGALPIVGLISFLLGLILAMQAWVQLRVWGAEIYMADMVGVSVVTEIGPLMTAIVLAARSGSSNAAQLGTMVVSEEIDALRQMGVDPMRFLVVPKILALAFSVVALGVLFDIVAITGGALFAYTAADIEPSAFRTQTQLALHLEDFLVAMSKSVAFGLCIGVVGCALGLQVKGGSQGVGRATTNAVVLSVFLIIVVDALFVTVQRMLL